MYHRKETLSEVIARVELEVKKQFEQYKANERYLQAWKDIKLSPWYKVIQNRNYSLFADL